MAETLAEWTAFVGARLLSSTGEASEHGESSHTSASENHDEEHDVSTRAVRSVHSSRLQRTLYCRAARTSQPASASVRKSPFFPSSRDIPVQFLS